MAFPQAERRGIPGLRRQLKPAFFGLAALVAVGLLAVAWGAATYNRLVRLDQKVQGQWAQVENA